MKSGEDRAGWLDDATHYRMALSSLREIERLEAALAQAQAENERAYQMLEVNGVPRDRARSVANGIDVLATRMVRENQTLTAALAQAQQDAKRYRFLRDSHLSPWAALRERPKNSSDIDAEFDKAIAREALTPVQHDARTWRAYVTSDDMVRALNLAHAALRHAQPECHCFVCSANEIVNLAFAESRAAAEREGKKP